jgi:hypothetical protein
MSRHDASESSKRFTATAAGGIGPIVETPTQLASVMATKRGSTERSGLSARVLLGALAVGGLLVSGIAFAFARGGDGSNGGRVGAEDPGPVHVHGLGINPADRSLMIATHTGTYRVAIDKRQPARIGGSRQDTMGFTVAGPDYFLGSGHPDMSEAIEKDLPPLLGLIESRDAGRTWRPVSLLGQADFHVLRRTGARVYGYDASNDRLLLSEDEGRTWDDRPRPAPLLDLAIHPARPSRLVASGVGGLYVTDDEGRAWTRLASRIGLVAWPSPESLYLVDAGGAVRRSGDSGRTWSRLGNVGGQPAALLAQTAEELYAALHDGTIKASLDGGRTWTVRSVP